MLKNVQELVLTKELVTQYCSHSKAFSILRFQAAQALAGNPYQINIEQIGNTVALKTRCEGLSSKNTVNGFDLESLDYLDEVLDFYRRDGLQCNLLAYGEDVASQARQKLAERHIYQTGILSPLVKIPLEAYPEISPGITIKTLMPDEIDLYLDLYFSAHGSAVEEADVLRPFELAENTIAGYHHYLMEIEGKPAAIAAMWLHGGMIGSFNATTLPAFRNRGCQTALIAWRLAAAARMNASLVAASAAKYSSSHRNLERAGFRYFCFGSTWKDFGDSP